MPTRSDAGRRWLTKALHPAEASIKAPKAPGVSRYPTVTQEVVSTFQLDPPPGITVADTWGFRLVTHTDPLCPMEVWYYITGDEEHAVYKSYFNQAFYRASDCFDAHTLAQCAQVFDTFQGCCETFRINALSTTGVFVGATMSDQGSILSSQFIDATRDVCIAPADATKPCTAIGNVWIDPLPPMSEAGLGQRPYVADARSGWYAPQKMENPGHWQRVNDVARRGRLAVGDNRSDFKPSDCDSWPALQGYEKGLTIWIRPYDDSCSQTFAKSLAYSTSFRITVRMVLEMGVTPNNDFAAFASDPLPPDPVAYELYMSIVNELQDAYPSDYNDLSKLWGKIKSVAKKVAGFIDPVAGIAAAAGVPFAKAVQGIARGVSGPNSGKYIEAEEDGLKSALDSIRAEREKRKADAEAKKSQKSAMASAKAKLRLAAKAAGGKLPAGGKP